jgi:hypothetical protein
MGRARDRTKTNNTMGNLQTPATWGGLEAEQKQTTQWAIYKHQQHGEGQRQDKNKQHNGQSTNTSNMGRARGRTKANNTMGLHKYNSGSYFCSVM